MSYLCHHTLRLCQARGQPELLLSPISTTIRHLPCLYHLCRVEDYNVCLLHDDADWTPRVMALSSPLHPQHRAGPCHCPHGHRCSELRLPRPRHTARSDHGHPACLDYALSATEKH
ncbi:hypothetical protein SORBI_3005G183450 [Sorghum bicolor]|uniref:Uncharacterized protein n=1 Tax=Sorghum bicolor TaxID=4558 RepID=A0A1Z5RJ79_SORBI|nr:hypothetical protein SORBI_3005G183450 [Sorghum bicolor]